MREEYVRNELNSLSFKPEINKRSKEMYKARLYQFKKSQLSKRKNKEGVKFGFDEPLS